MIEVYAYYARCNKEINKNMLEVIRASGGKAYDAPVNGYYKSIGEILDHYFIADTVWMKAFRPVRDSSVFADAIFEPDRKWGERQFLGLDALAEKRSRLDELILRYGDDLREEDFGREITRKNKNGGEMRKLLWKSVVHMFNHQTHHRGQISLVLDGLGIENDYSNMIRIE